MQIAFLTVFYPEMAPFLERFLQALEKQSYNQFDLVVVDDGFEDRAHLLCQSFSHPIYWVEKGDDHVENRLQGLKYCWEKKYDIIICCDSDEAVGGNRGESAVNYFKERSSVNIVYNNSEAIIKEKKFSLYYKDQLSLKDILDFNVLGYGALNLKKEAIPFILEKANKNVTAFDWWLACCYLMEYDKVDFLVETCNCYFKNENHFVGPVTEITEEAILRSIRTKKNLYAQLIIYSQNQRLLDIKALLDEKNEEIEEVVKYIDRHSIDNYVNLVKKYFNNKPIYWWREAVPLQYL